jgi:hypothetical protein
MAHHLAHIMGNPGYETFSLIIDNSLYIVHKLSFRPFHFR